MFLSRIVTIWFISIYTIYLICFAEGAVVRSQSNDVEEVSPYFKALISIDKSRIAEYERLKRTLMHYKRIDWDVIVQPRIRDDESSSS